MIVMQRSSKMHFRISCPISLSPSSLPRSSLDAREERINKKKSKQTCFCFGCWWVSCVHFVGDLICCRAAHYCCAARSSIARSPRVMRMELFKVSSHVCCQRKVGAVVRLGARPPAKTIDPIGSVCTRAPEKFLFHPRDASAGWVNLEPENRGPAW